MTLITVSAMLRALVWILVFGGAVRFRRPITAVIAVLVAAVNLLVVADVQVLAALLGTVASGGLAWLLIDRMQHDERRGLPYRERRGS